MMRRLLRGKVFYIVLTAFVIGLSYYGRAVHLGRWLPSGIPGIETEPAPAEWWTEEVDPGTLRTAASTDPVVRLMLLALSLFMGGMTFGGILLTIWAIATGRIRTLWRGPSHRLPPWTLGELWRITMLFLLMACLLQFARMTLIILWPRWSSDFNLWVNVSMLLLDVILLLTIFAFATDKTSPPSKALGLSAKTFSSAVSIGFRGYMVVFPWLLLLLFLVVEGAHAFNLKPPMQPIQQMIFMEERPLVLALTIILTCLVGPCAEEAFFRGVLFSALRQRTSRWVAMLVSGALFSMVHTSLIGFLPILLLGCLLADLYERTGSLASSIAIHILHNTFLLSLALTFRWAAAS